MKSDKVVCRMVVSTAMVTMGISRSFMGRERRTWSKAGDKQRGKKSSKIKST
jgi:hypothetical protein